jgi:predicted phosphoribosyltransferase
MTTFVDRGDAGRQLATRLLHHRLERPVVLGLPRGGVIVADEVARALEAPLDVMVVRKLGAPGNPEFAIGALAPGVTHFEEETLRAIGVSKEYLRQVVVKEQEELRRREARYRAGRPHLELGGKTVILVDDGLATGATALAAAEAVRARGARHLVVAVPVASAETIEKVRREVDELVCLETPPSFYAVGQAYAHFAPVSDEEVEAVLTSRPP